jgi:NADPH2:quinone reductase
MKALTFSQFGSANVLEYRDVPTPILKSDEILLEMKAIGLNFADIYRRKGDYHLKGKPPYIAGYEGAGIVKVSNNKVFKPGDRVAFADVPLANAELVAVPLNHAIPLPDDISFETASALLLQGLTAHYLATDSHKTQPNETVLVHTAAGGVGQLLTQISVLLGARVLGLVSSPEKRQIALDAGASDVFLYSEEWTEQVKQSTDGYGADVVYESVGTTLMESFAATRECGQIVFYGFSGGNPPPVNPRYLMDSSKTLTGGDLWSYLVSGKERIRRAEILFQWVREGKLHLTPPTTFALSDGRTAHEFLESRKSTGKIIFVLSGV